MCSEARPDKLLIVLGEGGHTKEMLALVDLLGSGYRYEYVLTREDRLSEAKIRFTGAVHRVVRPRSKDDNALVAAGKVLRCACQALAILRRSQPDAMITSGPALAVPFAMWARLLGVGVVFIETGSRVSQLSLTGRLIRPLADLFFVQWPALVERCRGAIYAGRLC